MEKKNSSGLTRRDFLYLGGLGMAGMLAGFPQLSHGAEKKPKYGGRLRVAERHGSSGLDVHKNQVFMDFNNYMLMYNALLIMGPLPDIKMCSDLAKAWDISPDGREYTFLIREGVKFHHGKELDSGDVKYSFDRVMDPATRAPKRFAFKWIDSVSVIDKYHIKFKLKEPFGPFLTTLTVQTCPIIPAGWEPTGTKPAPGTGPFVFKSFVPNETTEFTRFDQYWEIDEKTGDRLPYLDSIYVKKIVDATVRWVAIRTGEMDYIQYPPVKTSLDEQKKPTPGIISVLPEPVGITWVYLNCSKPPFDNKKVRQAIAYAVDKNELIESAYWGLGEALQDQAFLKRCWMHIPVEEREERKVNLEKAKQLLAEAGYPNGFKTEFFEYTYLKYVDAAQSMIAQVKRIGIEATIMSIDQTPWIVQMRKGDYAISLAGDSERLDPDEAYYMRLHSSEIGKNNWCRYSNKQMDELLEKARKTWKWEDRVPLYKKVVELIREEVPILYLCKSHIPIAIRDYVKGHEFGCATWFGYYGGGLKKVWLDK